MTFGRRNYIQLLNQIDFMETRQDKRKSDIVKYRKYLKEGLNQQFCNRVINQIQKNYDKAQIEIEDKYRRLDRPEHKRLDRTDHTEYITVGNPNFEIFPTR